MNKPDDSNRAGIRLKPEDYQFINLIYERISESDALPQNLPLKGVVNQINKCAKWFYEWYESATEPRWVFVSGTEIESLRDASKNSIIKLPDGIEAITDCRLTHASLGIKVSDYFKRPLLNSFGGGRTTSFANGNANVSDAIISMYEASTYDSLLSKGLTFGYNKNTQNFSVLGSTKGATVALQVALRIPLQDLYADYYFQEYCIANCMISFRKILGTYTFTLPGEVTINFDLLSEDGKELKEQIEAEVKEMNDSSMILTY